MGPSIEYWWAQVFQCTKAIKCRTIRQQILFDWMLPLTTDQFHWEWLNILLQHIMREKCKVILMGSILLYIIRKIPTTTWLVDTAIFNTYQTCNDCRARQRCACANQGTANAAAQVLQQLEQQGGPPQNTNPPANLSPPQPPHNPLLPSPVPPPQQLDPLLNPAISPEDCDCLERVCAKWAAVQFESCDGCEREWFDLDVQPVETGDSLCKDCWKSTPLFHKDNNLYPATLTWNNNHTTSPPSQYDRWEVLQHIYVILLHW